MNNQILFAEQHSQFISRWFNAKPSWCEWVQEKYSTPLNGGEIRNLFKELLKSNQIDSFSTEFLMKNLREIRQKTMLWLGVRDLNNMATLNEVTETMTCLAEFSLEYAMDTLYAELSRTHGTPLRADGTHMPLWIVGMGKLGGRELNISSDIDLVFVYEDDGDTVGGPKSLSHHEWFDRLGKRLIRAIGELTEDGFVFRVDMRLRPNGDSGPLVCSLAMLEEYFMVQGREWERYAWIKGRLVYPLEEGGSSGLPPVFDAVVRPFVFRRYLDFGVISAIRQLHTQIRHEANLRATNFPDRAADVKLGRGGIREIEFLAQMFQLIRGGQESLLRARPTLQILKSIVDLGLMDLASSTKLQQAYVFLRQVEHRLQWWDDAQVHYLPVDPSAQERIAQGLGYASRETFYVELQGYQDFVSDTFANAFVLKTNGETSENLENWSPPADQYPELLMRWEAWQKSGRFRAMNDVSRKNFAMIFKNAIELKPKGGERVLAVVLDFLDTISRRSSYLALLTEYPHALLRLLQIFEASSWAAEYLNKHPQLLDEILMSQQRTLVEEDPSIYWEVWRNNLHRRLDDIATQDNPQEQMMDALRQAHHAEIFQILLADLGIGRNEVLPVERVSDRLSALADIILEETLCRIWQQIANKYQLPSNFSELGFGVIAYGKLGGKELGYGSDLDLVFIYDANLSPIDKADIAERFAMLVRRMIIWLTSATSAGVLFDIDTRLRPNGSAGLMVSSVEAFESYQLSQKENSAWVWEHQALSRARFCAGDPRIAKHFEDIRVKVLTQPRDIVALRHEILEMRQKIHDGHPNLTSDFDVKHDRGGMVDIEFVVQYLVLAYACKIPELLANVGNIALLKIAGNAGLIEQELAVKVAQAYRILRHSQHRLRLDGADKSRISTADLSAELSLARDAVDSLWQSVMQA